MALFNIQPKLAIKIYDLLKQKNPALVKDFPVATSFFNFLNSELKNMDESKTDESVRDAVRDMIREEIKKYKKTN